MQAHFSIQNYVYYACSNRIRALKKKPVVSFLIYFVSDCRVVYFFFHRNKNDSIIEEEKKKKISNQMHDVNQLYVLLTSKSATFSYRCRCSLIREISILLRISNDWNHLNRSEIWRCHADISRTHCKNRNNQISWNSCI